MSDLKISQLPNASALTGTEEIAVVQGGVTKKTTIAAIAALISFFSDAQENFPSVTGPSVTTANVPNFVYFVSRNGQIMTDGVDYTRVGAVFTFVEALASDSITISYKY